MTLKLSTTLVTPWLPDLAAAASHLALMTADPYGVMDPLTVELESYSRAAVEWIIGARAITPDADLLFAGIPEGVTVTHMAGFDAVYNGTLGWAFSITAFVTSGYGSLTVPAEDVSVGFA